MVVCWATLIMGSRNDTNSASARPGEVRLEFLAATVGWHDEL